MKNTLFFDKEFNNTLLTNENTGNNLIYLNVETDNTNNPQLQVDVNGTITTTNLTKNTTNVVELVSSNWVLNGSTKIRFKNATKTGSWVTISFPQIVEGEATLYLIDSTHYAVRCSKPVGTIKTATGSNVSAASGTATKVTQIELDAGTYVVTSNVSFPPYGASNGNYRRTMLSTTSGTYSPTLGVSSCEAPVTGVATICQIQSILKVTTTTTYYLNAQHNAGAALNLTGKIEVVKLA